MKILTYVFISTSTLSIFEIPNLKLKKGKEIKFGGGFLKRERQEANAT
jgi:hypothetical protein